MLEHNSGPPLWNHFVQLIHKRFGPPLTESPIDKLIVLRREGSVDSFCNRFMALSCRDPEIIEAHQIQLFMAGLDQPLRTDVALQKPATMDEAIMYAHAYEQRSTATPAPSRHGHLATRPHRPRLRAPRRWHPRSTNLLSRSSPRRKLLIVG
jgi:hypothetical protein